MTRDEAIFVLEHIEAHGSLVIKAKEMAIEALKQEPCEDAISRQAAMRVLDKIGSDFDSPRNAVVSLDEIADAIQDLPNVNPQEKTGRWINRHIIANKCIDMIVCSECGEEFSYDAETGISEYNYCPNCGAKMESEEQESEDL